MEPSKGDEAKTAIGMVITSTSALNKEDSITISKVICGFEV
jgi:hypothetical protein